MRGFRRNTNSSSSERAINIGRASVGQRLTADLFAVCSGCRCRGRAISLVAPRGATVGGARRGRILSLLTHSGERLRPK